MPRRPKFETTTEEVLKKADFRVSFACVLHCEIMFQKIIVTLSTYVLLRVCFGCQLSWRTGFGL